MEQTHSRPVEASYTQEAGLDLDRQAIAAEAWDLINRHQSKEASETLEREKHDNARTAIMEGLTASGHLSQVRLNGTLEDINAAVLSRLLNGLSGELPVYEKIRRFEELCNELFIQKTFKQIATGNLKSSTAVLEISDYPDAMPTNQAMSVGYRPYNKKGMVRSTHLLISPDGTYTRLIETISRSHSDDGSSWALLSRSGQMQGDGPRDLVVLKNPRLYDADDYPDGVVDIQRQLDKLAGGGVRYGEFGNQMHLPYERVRQESASRERHVSWYIDRLAKFEAKLEAAEKNGNLSASGRLKLYSLELVNILRAICTLAPDYAVDCFGKAAADIYHQAALLEASGQHQAAMKMVSSAASLEQPVMVCGVGSKKETVEDGQPPEIDSVSSLVGEGKENWKPRKGVCIVKNCPSRPAQTEVGPCSVCLKCQKIFDKNKNPELAYAVAKIFTDATEIKKKDVVLPSERSPELASWLKIGHSVSIITAGADNNL